MNDTLHVAPDGPLFMVAVRSLAGVNPVGPRLWRNIHEHSRPTPTLKVSGLKRGEAEVALAEWKNFMRPLSAMEKRQK